MLGLPIPFSSKALTKLASVYLAGGSVKLCFVSNLSFFNVSPIVSSGIFDSKSSFVLSSLSSTYSVIKPLNFRICPFALNEYTFFVSVLIVAETVSYSALAIWLAINLL